MDFVECEDSNVFDRYNFTNKFPSNTYYPAGVICAKETNRNLCPTSGESGSPLMSQDNNYTFNRFTTDGILSFVKGCGSFFFGKYQSYIEEVLSTLDLAAVDTQGEVAYGGSFNPLVYTKLYCYLPWIAEQYDLPLDLVILKFLIRQSAEIFLLHLKKEYMVLSENVYFPFMWMIDLLMIHVLI